MTSKTRLEKPMKLLPGFLGAAALESWRHAMRKPRPRGEATWSCSGWQAVPSARCVDEVTSG